MFTVSGNIKTTENKTIFVKDVAGCSGCNAAKGCTKNQKIHEFSVSELSFSGTTQSPTDEKITFSISNKLLLKSVLLVYTLPLLIFLLSIWGLTYLQFNELVVAVCSLINLVLCYFLLKYSKITNLFSTKVSYKLSAIGKIWQYYFN